MKRFADLSSCRDYVHSKSGTLVGVEIGDGARNVNEEPFSGTVAFMPGNEVIQGKSQEEDLCYVHMPDDCNRSRLAFKKLGVCNSRTNVNVYIVELA